MTTSDYFDRMKAVGVKELKARLSEYLRQVKAGHSLLVTDRGEVVAEVRPARGAAPPVEDPLTPLVEAGEVTRARRPKAGWRWEPHSLGLPPGAAEQLLDELRGDRV